MATIPTKRKFTCTCIACYLAFVHIVSIKVRAEDRTPISIERRRDGDQVYFHSQSNDTIPCSSADNFTFMVYERQCVSNQELLNGCEFAIAPSGPRMPQRVAVYINGYPNETILTTISDDNIMFSRSQTDAVITHRGNHLNETIPLSDCRIESLEVYRGRQQAIEINHTGFTISRNATIKIDPDSVGYNIIEFKGELFRMNLSCASGLSGCVFFKVTGKTNITIAKFNGSLQAPLTDVPITSHIDPTTLTNTSGLTGSFLDIVTLTVLAVAGFMAMLLIATLCCTVLICCCTRRGKRTRKQTTVKDIPRKLRCEVDVSYMGADSRVKEMKDSESPSSGYYKNQVGSYSAYV